MGAWGPGPLSTDSALDWVPELEEGGEAAPPAAFQAAIKAKGTYDVDTDVASGAVAAAEVVAALRGRPGDDLPEEVSDWIATARQPPPADLVELARRSVERVSTDRELKECWNEARNPADRDACFAAMNDLLSRLS